VFPNDNGVNGLTRNQVSSNTKDLVGDSVVNSNDEQIIGVQILRITGGLNQQFIYKILT